MTILMDSPVNCVAFSGDGSCIVSGSDDGSVRVWDALSGVELKVLNSHTHSVQSVAFSSDGTHIVSGSDDRSVRVWDALSGVELKVLNGHTGYIQSVAFSSDGTHIVSGSYDKSVRVWDLANCNDLLWIYNSEKSYIMSNSGEDLLMWVPPEIFPVLYHPYNSLIISSQGSAKVDFQNCKIGPDWMNCYTPLI